MYFHGFPGKTQPSSLCLPGSFSGFQHFSFRAEVRKLQNPNKIIVFSFFFMAAKFNQKQALPFLETRVLRSTSSIPNTSHCFCSNSSRNENRALTKRFRRGLTERWDFTQARELLKSRRRYSPKLFLIHVVKEGETLTSISRLYGVSIQSIVAVNASIVDVDFVLEGQRLNIPFRAEETKMDPGWKIQLDSRSSHEKCQSPLNSLAAPESCKLSRFLSSHHLQNAKPTGYFLVLVPLIAFCIRCIIGTIQHRVAKDLKHQAANKPKAHNQGSRSIRWKSVLSDSRDSDAADTESSQDSVNPPEDVTVPFEDISHAYTKLEPAYLKFLSECGMSKWGYWRGGSLE
ncbi:DNA-directed RNA polymerase subunit beta [Cinnamomum micranthum f. kanehirae]|uniref:DNA-directed RNA polymerase subunit beta n=1 Tax=Cinnamomum micranthum f. kanehirae TaxID=337451 RepID=A0A3S3PKI9_9MAGN|nr:DNA-directed RNA polymerase subunit beta [Cinnamomum micranthum f. kanehirae]